MPLPRPWHMLRYNSSRHFTVVAIQRHTLAFSIFTRHAMRHTRCLDSFRQIALFKICCRYCLLRCLRYFADAGDDAYATPYAAERAAIHALLRFTLLCCCFFAADAGAFSPLVVAFEADMLPYVADAFA